MTQTFHALADEATFTMELLGSGVTQIGKANYAHSGRYFQAFTSLSTGLERIGKLCLMLDYYIKNQGAFPSMNYMKKQIGHDLEVLYHRSRDIVAEYGLRFTFMSDINDPLHRQILKILSDFAKGDRYSNLDFLISQSRSGDPIYEWFKRVDEVLYDRRVSKRKREKVKTNAVLIGRIMGQNSVVQYRGEAGEEITDIQTASFKTGMTNAVAKYRQLYVLHIIRYWVELLYSLQYKAMKVNKNDIPFFSDMFALYFNEDRYFLTRKTFESIR